MDKVYFLKGFDNIKSKALPILKQFFAKNSKVLIKLHFGEPGNKTALFPQDVQPFIDNLSQLNIDHKFIDTPVAYNSPRNTVEGYQKAARDRGWDELGEVIISDQYKKVKTKDLTAEVALPLIETENVLVLSHIKGHACAGFGGAIKNLGMGGLSAKTKSNIHDLCKPKFVSECQGCGSCVQLCPAGAVKMVDDQAEFNLEKCWGCSICQIQCPHHCLAPEQALFDDLLAQGASVCINNFKNAFYINLIKNITQYCDCESNPGELIAEDIGILFSQNPVAIDQASIDLIRKQSGKKVFMQANHKDPLLQLKYAAQHTDFSPEYNLIEL